MKNCTSSVILIVPTLALLGALSSTVLFDGRLGAILAIIALLLGLIGPFTVPFGMPSPIKKFYTYTFSVLIAFTFLSLALRHDMNYKLGELEGMVRQSDKAYLYLLSLLQRADSQRYVIPATEISVIFPVTHQSVYEVEDADVYIGFTKEALYSIRLAQYDKPVDPQDIVATAESRGNQVRLTEYRSYKAIDGIVFRDDVPTKIRTIIIGDLLLTLSVTPLRGTAQPDSAFFETVELEQADTIPELNLEKTCYNKTVCNALKQQNY